MYDLDHMLKGNGSRQHHQDMIRQAQQDKFARSVKPSAQANRKTFSPLRTILATLINLLARS